MIVCPVCEHPQAEGSECELCGKRLVQGPSPADLAIPPVDGLEPTRQLPADAGEERMPELEPTGHDAAIAGDDRTPDLEPTATAPVDVDVQPAPDVERIGEEIAAEARTAVPVVIPCRYCRTPAAAGERICSRCGMRLPVFDARPAPQAAVDGWRCTCGSPASGSLCPTCGARRPAA